MVLLLFPNQLFEFKNVATNFGKIILLEDPVFFGWRESFLKLNKLRLAYQIFLCREYAKKHKIQIYKIDDLCVKDRYNFLQNEKEIHLYNPMDHLLIKNLEKAGLKLEIHDTPAFLMKKEDIDEYISKYKGKITRLRHAPFYKFVKSKLKILENEKSYDKMNREPYPKDGKKPPEPFLKNGNKNVATFQNIKKYIDNHKIFKHNYGEVDIEYLCKLPVTHESAKEWFKKFLKERFDNFGLYEDAIVKDEPWMYHSGISIFSRASFTE